MKVSELTDLINISGNREENVRVNEENNANEGQQFFPVLLYLFFHYVVVTSRSSNLKSKRN